MITRKIFNLVAHSLNNVRPPTTTNERLPQEITSLFTSFLPTILPFKTGQDPL